MNARTGRGSSFPGARARPRSDAKRYAIGSCAEAIAALELYPSMTLFAEVADAKDDFTAVLGRYHGGERDRLAIAELAPR